MHDWHTHTVHNQVDELRNYDLLRTDPALVQALQRGGAQAWMPQLGRYAQQLGTAANWKLAAQANSCVPQLQRFDARGRLDETVEFHAAWHALLAQYRAQGWISLPFDNAKPGRWTAWAGAFYLHGQQEQGTLCPATMTTASIPLLQQEPSLWAAMQAGLFSRDYDASDAPMAQKKDLWIGMGMTEKQGGSDVRSNTTTAVAIGPEGRGCGYLLRGHKWFYSAPMSDAHVVVAQVQPRGGHACFLVPRWLPDGTRNRIRIQQLKDKLGNRSNSSAEVEFQDAWGVLVGDEGRGIATILEMATQTRLNCVLGSAAILRTATVQAMAYARQRQAFGKPLVAHALMRNVLVDLALESEAAMQLGMRLAQAFEHAQQPLERAWQRILTPAAKFWVCKRAVACTAEAMEVLGGNGYIDTSVMARLLREAPVNSIWEGSGNVMCLDVMRAIARAPDALGLLVADWQEAAAGDVTLKRTLQKLLQALQQDPSLVEAQARWWVQTLVLLAQACVLRRHAPTEVAEAFVATRLGPNGLGGVVGACVLSSATADVILQRAFRD